MALTNLSQVTSSGIHTLSSYTTHNINSTGIITATEFSGNLSNSSGISTFAEIRVTGNLTVEGTTTTLDSNLTEVDRIEVGANSASPGIAVTQSGTGAAAYFNGGDVNVATGNIALASATPMVVASNGSGHLRLGAGGSEKVRITSAGLVGIGTITPGSALEIRTTTINAATHYRNNASNGGAYFGVRATDLGAASAGEAYIYSYNSGINLLADGTGDINFATGGTASRVHITSDGEVTINNSDSNPSVLNLKGGGSTVSNGDEFAQVKFFTQDVNVSGNDRQCARISSIAENDHGSNSDAKTAIGFYTRRDESQSPVERLRITHAGLVGIGTDIPSSDLHISKLSANAEPTIKISSENSSIFLRTAGSNGSFPTGGVGNDGELIYLGGDFRFGIGTANKNLIFFNGSGYTERLRIDSNGNLGVNKTPETDWSGSYRAIEIGNSSVSGYQGNTYPSIELNMNCRGTAASYSSGWKYIRSMVATQIHMPYDGNVLFRRAASGSADGDITWSESMRVTSDGKIGISDTSPENTLSIKNIGSFEGDANSFYLGSNFTGTGQNF